MWLPPFTPISHVPPATVLMDANDDHDSITSSMAWPHKRRDHTVRAALKLAFSCSVPRRCMRPSHKVSASICVMINTCNNLIILSFIGLAKSSFTFFHEMLQNIFFLEHLLPPGISCTAYTCPHLRHFKLNKAKGKVLTFLPQTHSFPCSSILVGSTTLGPFLQPQTGCHPRLPLSYFQPDSKSISNKI